MSKRYAQVVITKKPIAKGDWGFAMPWWLWGLIAVGLINGGVLIGMFIE